MLKVFSQRPLPKTPPPVPDRALKPPRVPPRVPPRPPPRDWKKTSDWNPYLGQEVNIRTLSGENLGGRNALTTQEVDTTITEQSSTIRQDQEATTTIGEAFSDREPPHDSAITGASDSIAGGSGGTLPSAVDDFTAAGQLEPSPVASLNEDKDEMSPPAAGDPTTAPRSPSPAGPDMNKERNDERMPSAVGHSSPVLSVLGSATSDHIRESDSDMASSAINDLRSELESAFENRSPSKQANNIPRVFYGPNKITESSLYPSTYNEPDPATPAPFVEISAVQESDTDFALERDGFKTLSSNIELKSEVSNPPEQATTLATGSAPTTKSEEAVRSSTSQPDLNGSVSRSGSTRSVSGETEVNVNSDIQTVSQHLPPLDRSLETMLQGSETLSDEAIRLETPSSTSSNELATRAGLGVAVLSDQVKKETTDVPGMTPLSSLGLKTMEDANMKDRPLQLNVWASTTIESSSPSPPQRPPPLPPRSSEFSSPASQPPLTPMSSTIETDLYTIPSARDSSCGSFSDLPEVNTAESIQYCMDNSAATSSGIAPPSSLREQGQFQLRNLRSQLAAAKARGDAKSQEDAIQRSIDVIWRTQLSPPLEPVTSTITKKTSSSPKLKNRTSMLRIPLLTSSTKSEALGQAAADGDEATLTKLLRENVHVNCTSLDSKTPMMRAALNGRVPCMSILTVFGADECAVDKLGATALHHAILSNQTPAVKWILEAYRPSEAIRHRSSIMSRMDTANWGRSHRVLREMSDTKGLKPLHIAVEHAAVEIVETLLAAGANMEAEDKQGRTPLMHAILASRWDSFDNLLRSGARIDHKDVMGMSALHWAARSGQVAMIAALLEKGAGRLDYDSAGYEPIHQAAAGGHILAVEALLIEGSELDRPTKSGENRNGESMLHIASLHNHLNLARYLLKNGVQVNHWSDRAQTGSYHPRAKLLGSSLTPLHYACCLGHFEMAVLLIDHNAMVNAATEDGYTPLMMAVEAENTDLVALLHNRGAKVNASLPGTLLTALHMAARRGDLDTVKELIRAGADFKARAGKHSYKCTALETCDECADKRKRDEVVQYLSIIHRNDTLKRGLPSLQPSPYYQHLPSVQHARNSTFSQQPAPPPPYSKEPPVWR